MRVALVELDVDLTGVRADGRPLSRCVREGIGRAPQRGAQVRAALVAATASECDVIVFPGWTLVGRRPPAWLLAASKHLTISVEMFSAASARGSSGRDWQTYVLDDGNVLIGPSPQVIATSGELNDAALHAALLHEIVHARLGSIRGRTDALLLVCGEANVVRGGGASRDLRPHGIATRTLQQPLVLNPAHTPGGPQAMRDKRAWLSRRGCVVTTANTFSGLAGHNSKRTAAIAWVRGERVPLREAESGAGWRLKVFDYEPTPNAKRQTRHPSTQAPAPTRTSPARSRAVSTRTPK